VSFIFLTLLFVLSVRFQNLDHNHLSKLHIFYKIFYQFVFVRILPHLHACRVGKRRCRSLLKIIRLLPKIRIMYTCIQVALYRNILNFQKLCFYHADSCFSFFKYFLQSFCQYRSWSAVTSSPTASTNYYCISYCDGTKKFYLYIYIHTLICLYIF